MALVISEVGDPVAGVKMTVVNKAEILKQIGDIKDVKAKRAFDYTRKDLVKNVPRLAAQIASGTYSIARTKLNPNTKAGGGKGHVSASGGDLLSLEFEYRGRRLHVGTKDSEATFRLTPAAHNTRRKYKLRGKILKGGSSPYGHWSKPWSEGGRYGYESPFMLLPDVGVPVQRHGEKFDKVALGLSVPQMVVSERTKKHLSIGIETMMLERLEHNLARVL